MRINVISLERTPDRLAEFRQLNKHLSNITVHKAVDGNKLSQDEMAAKGLIIAPPIHYSPGALGNMMSHIALWDHAATSGEITTVCEDDAILNFDFEARALDVMSALPDATDIVYWGWNFDAPTAIDLIPGMSPCATTLRRNPLPREIETFQSCRMHPVAHRLLRAFGTLCYTITPHGARRLRKLCLPVRNDVWDFPEIDTRVANLALDVAICHAMPSVSSFCSFPPLAMSLNDRRRSNVQLRPPS
jgi:glycosyl transferase family 25